MALFSKPPAKKPGASGSERANEGASAKRGIGQRAPDAPGPATLTQVSLIDWSNAYSAIEVSETNPGLCSVLENAALLYAAGQPEVARTTLADGLANDADARSSPLAWLAMFDLLQRANLRGEFDELALEYVVQFERSAPGWDETVPVATRSSVAGGYVAPTGKLTGAGTQLAGLRRAIDKRVPGAKLDLSSVVAFDEDGAKMLAELLALARKHRLHLAIERPEKLAAAVDAAVRLGKEGGEGAWLLSLELLQWQRQQTVFDDRAVDFAVTFEVSPPSWDPPPDAAAAPAGPAEGAAMPPAPDADAVAFTGTMVGPGAPQIAVVAEHAHRNEVVRVDMTRVERIDFVCAGAFLNAVGRVESQRKSVQILGASPIIRALLLLIGVSPRHFVKKV